MSGSLKIKTLVSMSWSVEGKASLARLLGGEILKWVVGDEMGVI